MPKQLSKKPVVEKPMTARERRRLQPEQIAQEIARAEGLPLERFAMLESGILKIVLLDPKAPDGKRAIYEPLNNPD